jgi:hypothetical protein
LFPLWPVVQRVTSDIPAGVQYLELDAVTEPLIRATQTEALDAWGQGPALLVEPDGDVQQVEIIGLDDDDLEATTVMPLARPVAAGSLFVPLVPGQLADSLTSTRHSGAISRQSIEFSAAERVFEYFWEPYLFLEQTPVMIDHEQWQPEPTIEYAARIERIDNHVGNPWIRRVDDRPSRILSRRWLVQGQWEIDRLLSLFEYLAGRLNPIWLPDEHTGIRLAQPVFTGDDRLTIQRKRLPWHWEEPGLGLLIRGYDDEPTAVRIAALEAESDTEARLLLADPLEVDVPMGTPMTPLHFARLEQDQVEFHWHTRDIVEVAARFATLARCHLYAQELGE